MLVLVLYLGWEAIIGSQTSAYIMGKKKIGQSRCKGQSRDANESNQRIPVDIESNKQQMI